MSLLLVVSAEMIAATRGLGYLILYAGDLLQTTRLMAGIAVLSALGLLSTWIAGGGHHPAAAGWRSLNHRRL